MRAGKRPQLEVIWGEARITALAPQADGSKVWVANATGHMEALDLKGKRMQVRLRGCCAHGSCSRGLGVPCTALHRM